jgi:L,D-transpeptidase catalytic domain
VRFGVAVLGLLVGPFWAHAARAGSDPAAVKAIDGAHKGYTRAEWNEGSIGALNTNVFDLALGAASCAARSGAVTDPATLTVIDYSLPSTAKRLWVYDLRAHELLYEELVAHGQGSGENVPTIFSNEEDTHRSSLGLFVTDDTYIGKNGYSLRLDGLESGFNDRARDRAIVIHGAPYVSESFVRSQGRLGRSWGCPALREGIVREVIDRVKGGGLLFVYYPDQTWLNASKYLGSCAAAAATSAIIH